MSDTTMNDTASQKTQGPSPKRKKAIVVSVVAAIVVVAGIGGWVWHETPSFCGTVCHSTMDEHLQNFYGTDASGGAGLASVHAEAGETCLTCHEADLESQLTELKMQVTGTYGDLELGGRYYVDDEKCLSCHGESYDALAEKTADLGAYNPHESVHGQMSCNECHKGHVAQVDTCGECHENGGQTMLG